MKIKGATLVVEGYELIELEASTAEVGASSDPEFSGVAPGVCVGIGCSVGLTPEDLYCLRLMIEPVPPWVM